MLLCAPRMQPSVVLALILRTNTGRIAFVIILAHLIVAVSGPWISPYPPTDYDLPNRFSGPTTEHWLGTDDKGRDVLSRVLAGSRSIIWIAAVGTVLGVTLGTIVGISSGYFGGKIDQTIMRFVDWFLAIPSLLLAHPDNQYEQAMVQRLRRIVARHIDDRRLVHAQQQPRHKKRCDLHQAP